MKPLICPRCGGKITDYDPAKNFTVCNYCETKFIIEKQTPKPFKTTAKPYKPARPPKPKPITPKYQYDKSAEKKTFSNNQIALGVFALTGLYFCAVIISMILGSEKVEPVYTTEPTPKITPTATSKTSPTPTPNLNLLEFGGKGTGEGLFEDSNAIAVDKNGRIYVSDDSLRVQQFDAEGKFLKLWQIPSETKNYKKAKTIHKIAVDGEDKLYVAVGGVILVYGQTESEPFLTMFDAPDYVMDFDLRSDGTVLLLSNNDRIETLFFVNKNKKITRSIRGFHTDTADASMSPPETGLAAIRIAVDGAGNIYSIYALGDLGGYQLSYDREDFRIFRFNADGKYVNKFVETMDSVGIETDDQSRIYISRKDAIEMYSNEGNLISVISGFKGLDAFALDAQNNIYILHDDRVVKRSALRF